MFASMDLKVICVLYLSNFPQRYKTSVVIFHGVSSGVPDQGPVYWRLISAINLKSNYNPDSFIPLFMGTISLFPVEHPVIKLKTIRVILNFLPRLPDLKSDFTLIQDYLNLDLKKPAPHCILYFKYWLGSFVLIPEFSLKKSTILLGLWRRMSK